MNELKDKINDLENKVAELRIVVQIQQETINIHNEHLKAIGEKVNRMVSDE